MVKVTDSNGDTQTFQGADYFMVTKEGVLMLLKNSVDQSVGNSVAAFGPGRWHAVLKEQPPRPQPAQPT